jgi:hypothetical protein
MIPWDYSGILLSTGINPVGRAVHDSEKTVSDD